jgi:hypothetical protein
VGAGRGRAARGAVPVVDAVGDVERSPGRLTRLIVAPVPTAGADQPRLRHPGLLDIIDEITWWTGLPVCGYFFDHAPTQPYQVGPLTRAIRVARRAGLGDFVLNPGMAVDPIYPAACRRDDSARSRAPGRHVNSPDPAESFAHPATVISCSTCRTPRCRSPAP